MWLEEGEKSIPLRDIFHPNRIVEFEDEGNLPNVLEIPRQNGYPHRCGFAVDPNDIVLLQSEQQSKSPEIAFQQPPSFSSDFPFLIKNIPSGFIEKWGEGYFSHFFIHERDEVLNSEALAWRPTGRIRKKYEHAFGHRLKVIVQVIGNFLDQVYAIFTTDIVFMPGVQEEVNVFSRINKGFEHCHIVLKNNDIIIGSMNEE